MKPEQLIDEIRRRRGLTQGTPALKIYWVTVLEDRDLFRDMVRRSRGNNPVIPLVLRKGGLFRDPNAVMNDVSMLLADAEEEILMRQDCARNFNGVDLLLLSRGDLQLSITSSPLQLPEWFPVMPGAVIAAHIEDLTWSVQVPLSDSVVARTDLQRILYELDWALLTRIKGIREKDHRRVNAFCERIRRNDEDNISQALDNIEGTLKRVANPNEFRPSSSKSPTLIGRMWSLANKISPDKQPTVAKELCRALDVKDRSVVDDVTSLTAVLNRPNMPIVDSDIRWSFQLIVAVRSACQLVTAASHADEYPMFPDVLLRTISFDLRKTLDTAVHLLKL